MTEFDARPRSIAAPETGYWLVRRGQGFPWCPAAILRLLTAYEPECPENRMEGTRSPFLAAFVSGEPVSIAEVWERRGRPISRAEYQRQLAEMAANLRLNRYDPRFRPGDRVKLAALTIPFARRA